MACVRACHRAGSRTSYDDVVGHKDAWLELRDDGGGDMRRHIRKERHGIDDPLVAKERELLAQRRRKHRGDVGLVQACVRREPMPRAHLGHIYTRTMRGMCAVSKYERRMAAGGGYAVVMLWEGLRACEGGGLCVRGTC